MYTFLIQQTRWVLIQTDKCRHRCHVTLSQESELAWIPNFDFIVKVILFKNEFERQCKFTCSWWHNTYLLNQVFWCKVRCSLYQTDHAILAFFVQCTLNVYIYVETVFTDKNVLDYFHDCPIWLKLFKAG